MAEAKNPKPPPSQNFVLSLHSWLRTFISGTAMTKWQSDIATTCFRMSPRKVTLPGILVRVSIASCPARMSWTRCNVSEATLSTCRVSREGIVVDLLPGMLPGYISTSPTCSPWYRSILCPDPCLKLAWFGFSTRIWRLRVMLSWILTTGNEIRGEMPSRVAETSWVLGCLALKTVKTRMSNTMKRSMMRKMTTPIAMRHRCLRTWRRFLASGTGSGSGFG